MDLPVALGGTRLGQLPTRPWPMPTGSELQRLKDVLESGIWGFDGPFEREFEERFAALQTAQFGLCVANGTVAVQLALEALDIGVGDEVIVPGMTWQATAAAVLDVNAMPVLVDVEPETYCIDPQAVEAAITERTRAVIVVHLFDGIVDMDGIMAIAARHGIAVIEDCAHSHGSRWNGRGVGSLGDLGTFSFQSTKSVSAGEGGFVATGSEHLRERVYSLRNCGRRRLGSSDDVWQPIQSGNYRITEWQAAVLLSQLERMPSDIAKRQVAMTFLDTALAQLPGIRPTLRRPQVTQQGMYGYVFRYDAAAFDGLPGRAFQAALSAELGVPVRPPYEPLNASPLYRPHTKRRHHLSEEYWNAIDPARFALPVAEKAHREEGTILSHEVLLLDPADLEIVALAIERVRSHASALLAWHESTETRVS